MFYKIFVLKKFRKKHRKTPLSESHCSKVAGAALFKKWIRQRCFTCCLNSKEFFCCSLWKTTKWSALNLLSPAYLWSLYAQVEGDFCPRPLSLDRDKSKTWNLVQSYCTIKAFEKVYHLLPRIPLFCLRQHFLCKSWKSIFHFQRAR